MTETIIVALIAFAGTSLGTLGGILTASKLTNYRIEQLEKKVDKHNNFAERIPVLEEKLEFTSKRLGDVIETVNNFR